VLDGEEGDVGKAFKEAGGDEAEVEKPQKKSRFPVVDNEARKPRGMEEMIAEAEMLAREMEKEPLD
jgi:bis(5'-adenosyl)-triphosphatase